MNIKNLVFTLVALAFSALTAWQGPTVAGAIAALVVAACVLVLSLHVVPPKAVEYIEDLEDALQKSAPDAAKSVVRKADGPKGGAIATLLVLVGVSCCVVANTTACGNKPLVNDVTTAFTTISGCVVSSIETGGLSDPIQIAAQCGGIVIAQVIAIIENEIARERSDAGSVGASAKTQLFESVLANAKTLQAKSAP